MDGPVITFSCEPCSSGDAVAVGVAARLGLPLYDHEVVTQAAREAGVTEREVAHAERYQRWLGRLHELCLSALLVGVASELSPELVDDLLQQCPSSLRQRLTDVVRRLALAGPCVLVGHGGAQVALRGWSTALHVFIRAPLTERVGDLQRLTGCSAEVARRTLTQHDQEWHAFFMVHYGVDVYDVRLYDLVLNSSGRSVAALTEEICGAARSWRARDDAGVAARTVRQPPEWLTTAPLLRYA